jgi:Spy/CpxP family protein refolding chaperone
MRTGAIIAVAAALVMPQALAAQGEHMEAIAFTSHLFPPELVMRHQRSLELTDEQRGIIRERVKELQTGVLDLQWQLQDQQQVLGELMATETVDERAALQQMDRVLELESQIKRNHFRLLVEIKNTLNAEQQQKLHEIMEFERQPRGELEILEHGMMGSRESREHAEQMLHLERVSRLEQLERERRRHPPI